MPHPALQELPPDTPLLVSPVYFAGAGNTELISRPLESAAGWSKSATDTGTCFTSPCGTVRITHLPGDGPGSWRANAERALTSTPVWSASFSANVPAEIVAAFTTTLADGLRSSHRDYLSGGPHRPTTTPAAMLTDRGWHPKATPEAHHQLAPGENAGFSLRRGGTDYDAELAGAEPPQWAMYCDPSNAAGLRWRATFTSATPLYLITAAARVFSDPAPVTRRLGDLPLGALPHLTDLRLAKPALSRSATALARTSTPGLFPTAPSSPPSPTSRPSTPAPGPRR